MNRFGIVSLGTSLDGNEASDVFVGNGMGKIQIFVKASAGTTGTFKVQFSPDNQEWFTPSDSSATLVGTETGDAAKMLYAIHTAAPYVRVACEGVAVGTLKVRAAFTENN